MRLSWMTTCPTGRAHTHGADCGQTGWKLHAVDLEACTDGLSRTEYGAATTPHGAALCGLRPNNGWALDLFITDVCTRCDARAEKLKLELPDIPR